MATFGTFVSGQVLTAAELNSAGEWQSYTPTWTQSATITKTVNWARYTQLNKLVIVNIKMTASSAGTSDNVIKIGLPVNASTNNSVIGQLMIESGGTGVVRIAFFDSATTAKFYQVGASFTVSNQAWGQTGGGTTGATTASGDVVYVQLMYEAA